MYNRELYQRIRRACHVEGMSIRKAARVFGVHRGTVRKMLRFSIPPATGARGSGCGRKLGPYHGGDRADPRGGQGQAGQAGHTALRIYQRLKDEHGFTGRLQRS